nr:LysR substrate-binding domain-containing protein [Verticiella sp. GG226]
MRSFEAAGRHHSFTRAAQELHVTPVAISRQVAVLESYFGVPLFDRHHQTVHLTPAGRQFLPRVTAALDLLDEGSRLLRPEPDEALVVCTYTTFALRWLIPRLAVFRQEHPAIDINFSTAVTYEEFHYDRIDVGLQYVYAVPADVSAQVILPDLIQPICSPRLLETGPSLPPVENLRRHTLLHSEYRKADWADWLDAVGAPRFKPADESTFKGSGLAYQAASGGLGVAVAQRLLILDDLADGRVVTPFPHAVQRTTGLSMVSRKSRLADSRVKIFRDWLEAQATQTWRAMGLEDVVAPARPRLVHMG